MPHFGPLQLSSIVLPNGIVVAFGASPFSYAAPSNGLYIVTGGTITQMTYTRNGTGANFGSNTRLCAMRKGDTITVTYSVVPTSAAFVPDA